MTDDLVERLEASFPGLQHEIQAQRAEAAARIRELEAQGVAYAGEIEPGMRFVWERGNPHAECEIMVTEVRERENDERAIYSIAKDATYPVWNDESRFREAVRAPVTEGLFQSLSDEQKRKALSVDQDESFGPDECRIIPVTVQEAARVLIKGIGPYNPFWNEETPYDALRALAGQGGEA